MPCNEMMRFEPSVSVSLSFYSYVYQPANQSANHVLPNATLCMHPTNPTSATALIQIATILRLLGLLLRRLVGRHELDDDDEELRVGLLVLQRVSERVRAG
jgi:hypothetical protein